MSPWEHYDKAESWLRLTDEVICENPDDATAVDAFDSCIARAQVHATLACADPDVLP